MLANLSKCHIVALIRVFRHQILNKIFHQMRFSYGAVLFHNL